MPMILGYDTKEICWLVLACLGGFLSGGLWLFSDLLGSYLYSQTLEKFIERRNTRGKPIELAVFFRLAPIGVLIACLFGGAALVQQIFPLIDFVLYRKVVKEVFLWSMGAGLVGGVVLRRYCANKKQEKGTG